MTRLFIFVFGFSLAIDACCDAQEPDEVLFDIIDRLEDGLQTAQDEANELTERLDAFKKSMDALNDIVRFEYKEQYPDYASVSNDLNNLLLMLEPQIDEIFCQDNLSIDDLQNLSDYAILACKYHIRRYPVDQKPRISIDTINYKSTEIHRKIAGLTTIEHVKNELRLGELGLDSRKWLVVLFYYRGTFNSETEAETLVPLRQYIEKLNEHNIHSDIIEETILDAQSAEIQTYYWVREYEKCIETVNRYFGDTIASITQETPETIETREALIALDHKIQAIVTPIRPDIFDHRKMIEIFKKYYKHQSPMVMIEAWKAEAKRYQPEPQGRQQLLRALEQAKFMASFGDKHTYPHSVHDVMKKRWRLVINLYDALDMSEKREQETIRLVEKYPQRFSSYKEIAEMYKKNAEIKKTNQALKERRNENGLVRLLRYFFSNN